MSNKKINQKPDLKNNRKQQDPTPSMESYTPPKGDTRKRNEVMQTQPAPKRRNNDSQDDNK